MRAPTLTLVLALAAAGWLAGAAPAQSRAATLVEDDVRFAENLAKFGYYELASEVLAAIKSRKTSTEEEGSVGFAEARILKRASENTADDALRLKLQTQAIDILHDWSQPGTAYAFHPRRPDALGDLASLYQQRGTLRARTAREDPARADTLRELADKDFAQADATLTSLQADFEKRAEQAAAMEDADLQQALHNEAAATYYKLGLNGLDWAEVAQDPAYRLEKAFDALVDFQWEQTEETLGQYGALHYQGVARHRQAALEEDEDARQVLYAEALEIQDEVLEKGRWYWEHLVAVPETERDPAVALLVAEVFDRAWGGKAFVHADAGDLAKAEAAIDTMLAEHDKARQPFPRAGFDVLLDWAEVLRGVGSNARSGELIKLVADGAASLPQGERARRLLADIFAGGSVGTNASPTVLLAAARGLFDKGEFAEAAYAYASAAAAATSPRDRQAVAVDAWLGAGRALSQVKRHLEAGLAHERALAAAVELGADEDTRQSAAGGMYNAYSARFNETREEYDKALRDKASRKLAELGIEGDIPFFRALERFAEAVSARPPQPALYRAAREEFEAAGPSAPSYERALVAIARCLVGEERHDEALAAFDAVFARAQDPALKPANTTAQSKRDAALAEAYNYKAEVLLDPAVGRPEEALRLLEGFEAKLPGQPAFIESVKSLRVRAFCRLARYDEAEAELAALLEFRAGSAYARVAAFDVAQALATASEAARTSGDTATRRDLLSRAAAAMWTYNELAGFVSFANLVTNGDWYAQVGSHAEAARAYQQAVEAFDRADAGVSPAQLDEARLGLAAALTQLREFGKARPYWQDLVARRPTDPRVLRGAARGFGGWLEPGPDGSVSQVDGSGDHQRASELWTGIHERSKTLQPQEIWWESKLGALYAFYRLGASQPQALLDARRVLDQLKLLYPEYDATTIGSLPPEQRYEPLYKPLFEYLDKKVPR
jgi:hypothetical protein